MQMPSHAVAQQTPCAQWLLAHSASLEQVSRDGRMQLPFTQGGAVQSASRHAKSGAKLRHMHRPGFSGGKIILDIVHQPQRRRQRAMLVRG